MTSSNTSRDATHRAAKSRREIGSENGTMPNPTQSGLCPIRLSAIDNAEVVRSTWMGCLRDLRAHMTEIKNGGDVEPNAEPVLDRLYALFLICSLVCAEESFCPKTNLNHALTLMLVASLGPLLPKLSLLGKHRQLPISAEAVPMSAEAVPNLIGLALEYISEEEVAENLEAVAATFSLPYCSCSSCHTELWCDYLSSLSEKYQRS